VSTAELQSAEGKNLGNCSVSQNYLPTVKTSAAGTNISYLEIGEKTGMFGLTYQPHSSSTHCARELFKPSKDLASL